MQYYSNENNDKIKDFTNNFFTLTSPEELNKMN